MGNADIDLPDPFDKPSLESVPNADDLLAQMAGDEIDRLLAEAEAHPKSAQPAASAEPQPLVTEEQIDALLAEAETEQPAPPAPPASHPTPIAAAKAPDPQINDQLDALFAELNNPPPEDEAESPSPAKPAAAPVVAAEPAKPPATPAAKSDAPAEPPPVVEAKAPPVDPAEQTGSLERQVLAAEILDADEPEEPSPAVAPDPVDRISLIVRVLEWVNLPVVDFSSTARSFMGMAAILTLLNALGILGYVLMFRK